MCSSVRGQAALRWGVVFGVRRFRALSWDTPKLSWDTFGMLIKPDFLASPMALGVQSKSFMNTAFATSMVDVLMEHEVATPLADRFAALRGLMTTSTELAVPWRYYQEEMGTRLEFMTEGRWGKSKIVNAALRDPMRRAGLIGRPNLTLTSHLERYGFWHGIRVFDSKTGIFFLDKTLRCGLLGVQTNLPRGPVELFQFTLRPLAEGAREMEERRRLPAEHSIEPDI